MNGLFEQKQREAGIPDLWVMFSGDYFWNRSLCFDLIAFDSTSNGAGVGDVQKYMLSEWSSIVTLALEMEVECMASQLEADFWQS